MNSVLTELTNSIAVATTQEQYKDKRPSRAAATADGMGAAGNDKLLQIQDELNELNKDLQSQIRKMANIERDLSQIDDNITDIKSKIVIVNKELKDARKEEKKAAAAAAKKNIGKKIQILETAKSEYDETLKTALNDIKIQKKAVKDNEKKKKDYEFSLLKKTQLQQEETKKNTFFSACKASAEDFRRCFSLVTKTISDMFSIGSMGGKLSKKKTTKKHYRKHYNTKKKQVRRFVKKTKMNKRRISKQSRRHN